MNLADDCNAASNYASGEGPSAPLAPGKHPLHRIAEVRRQQGVSPRSVARRTGMSMEEVRAQQTPTADLKLSDLYLWQKALEVPVADLLVDAEAPLSEPVLCRARMLRAMKTVRAVKEANRDPAIGRFVTMLENQLLEIMPELEDVSAWHSVGQRRTQDEVGRVAERPVSGNFVRDGLR